jgi:hypothetical protein
VIKPPAPVTASGVARGSLAGAQNPSAVAPSIPPGQLLPKSPADVVQISSVPAASSARSQPPSVPFPAETLTASASSQPPSSLPETVTASASHSMVPMTSKFGPIQSTQSILPTSTYAPIQPQPTGPIQPRPLPIAPIPTHIPSSSFKYVPPTWEPTSSLTAKLVSMVGGNLRCQGA